MIAGNSAENSGGGGIALLGSAGQSSPPIPKIFNVVISGNSADTGGGVYMRDKVGDSLSQVFAHVTIAGNTATSSCGGIQRAKIDQTQSAFLDNSIVWGNSTTGGQIATNDTNKLNIRYSDIQGSWTCAGSNIINADPRFVKPSGPDGADNIPRTVDDGLRLCSPLIPTWSTDCTARVISPCIDSGKATAVNDLIPADETDLDVDGNTTEATPRDLLLQVRRADDPNIAGPGAPSGSCALAGDVSITSSYIPSPPVQKPGGHTQCYEEP